MTPNLVAVTIYLVAMFAFFGYAAMMALAWYIRRTPMIAALSMFFLFAGIGAMSRVFTRSPLLIVPIDTAFWMARLAEIGMIVNGFGIVETYLASTNSHLSILRRVWHWWDKQRAEREEAELRGEQP